MVAWGRPGQTDMWWGGIEESRDEWEESGKRGHLYQYTPPTPLTLPRYTIIKLRGIPSSTLTTSSLGHGPLPRTPTDYPRRPPIPANTYIAAALDGLKLSHDIRAVQLGKAP